MATHARRQTATAPSARIYKETATDLARSNEPSTVPTGMAVFPGEPFLPVRRLVERAHHIVHWSELDRGGHFPAMEVPHLLISDLRQFFRRFR
jgi:pimeloyl-ACP methyl ester carboxylesterase